MKLKCFLIVFLFICIEQVKAAKYILVTKDNINKNIAFKNDTIIYDGMFDSLKKAHDYIINNHYDKERGEILDDIIIHIRQGVYKEGSIFWEATSPRYILKIVNYYNEQVVFDGMKIDGEKVELFFELENKFGRTNLWIEGLTIQNYNNGIWLGKTIRDETGQYFKGVQNSNNTIINNNFKYIGNKGAKNYGEAYSALGVNNSNNNRIENNIFFHIENDKLDLNGYKTDGLMHAIYIAHYSEGNIIRENFIFLCSGDALRIRNASHDNAFYDNYIQLSGTSGYVSEWYRTPDKYKNSPEEQSNGTVIGGNICIYSYPDGKKKMKLFVSLVNNGKLDDNYIDKENNFVVTERLD